MENNIKKIQETLMNNLQRLDSEKDNLSDDDYILFLNQDRNDYSKENLFKSSNREQCYLHNWGTFSSNPNLTKISILSARLTIKAKEVKNG